MLYGPGLPLEGPDAMGLSRSGRSSVDDEFVIGHGRAT